MLRLAYPWVAENQSIGDMRTKPSVAQLRQHVMVSLRIAQQAKVLGDLRFQSRVPAASPETSSASALPSRRADGIAAAKIDARSLTSFPAIFTCIPAGPCRNIQRPPIESTDFMPHVSFRPTGLKISDRRDRFPRRPDGFHRNSASQSRSAPILRGF